MRALLTALLVAPLFGCANVGYYAQAINGQLAVYAQARPIADIISDPAADPQLKEKLTAVLHIRAFASRELGLPDNDSYRLYADLGRPYALWNVFATPELSLQAREWCFMVTGCVGYRGYFDQKQAEAFAAGLRAAGDDVHVAGVAAYSTLGWFHDPVLNTVIQRPLPEIAGLVFHELAHQRLYVRGDTAFSESFAMAVELEGVRRWLDAHGTSAEYAAYESRLRRREEFVGLVLKHRDRLEALYQSDATVAEKRAGKAQIFAELRAEYAELKATRWEGYAGYDRWFAQDLNNAHLVSLGMYHRHVPVFRAMIARHQGDLLAFYHDVETLGGLPTVERLAALNAFLPTPTATLEDPER